MPLRVPARKAVWFAILIVSLSLMFTACQKSKSDNSSSKGGTAWQGHPQMQAQGPEPTDGLTSDAIAALDVAPKWLYFPLLHSFKNLHQNMQDTFAAVLLNASDPRFVDELAFIIAHSAPEDLNLANANYPALLEDNVRMIYERADQLDYVDVVEHGDASKGGDFYTTLKYYLPDGDFELPRDIYYWYIVHPRMEDETPAYVDPASGHMADPPNGHFWREYLWADHSAEICPNKISCGGDPFDNPAPCPTLPTMLQGVTHLWENNTGFDDNGAIGVVSKWILGSMCFGAGTERPIQPVRIYDIHRGNCGEWADISDSAARSALIPALNVAAYSNDHTWNQFFIEDWHHWEPVNGMIDAWSAYDADKDDRSDGWWFAFAMYTARGDGYASDNTQLYSATCTLNVTVKDSNGNPADGVNITSANPALNFQIAHFNDLTDSDGKLTALLGDHNHFYFKATSPLGNFPDGDPVRVITYSKADETYTWDVALPNARTALDIQTLDAPAAAASNRYHLSLSVDFPTEFMTSKGIIAGLSYTKEVTPGHARIFICDDANYQLYSQGSAFQAYQTAFLGTGTLDLDIPKPGNWYVIVSNEESVVAAQAGTVQLSLTDAKAGGAEVLGNNWTLYLKPGDKYIIGIGGL